MRLSGCGLVCRRGGRTVFANLDFAVASGEALLVVGPNGAGKSSLLRLVAGLLRPAAGRIELAGGERDDAIAEHAHYLGHQDALKPALTVSENLRFWSRFLGGGNASAALDAVGLGALGDLPAGYLSAGQRRRLSVARLLALHRPIWLLDEPASALDTGGQAMLTAVMRRHLAEGGLILAATHASLDLDGARELRLGGAPANEPSAGP
jgi:heme exporter protein A